MGGRDGRGQSVKVNLSGGERLKTELNAAYTKMSIKMQSHALLLSHKQPYLNPSLSNELLPDPSQSTSTPHKNIVCQISLNGQWTHYSITKTTKRLFCKPCSPVHYFYEGKCPINKLHPDLLLFLMCLYQLLIYLTRWQIAMAL